VIPAVPQGATVQSLLTALIRIAPAISLRQAPERYFGVRTISNDMYTVHADNLSKLAFAGHVSAHQIRRHHGILPLTMAFREREQEAQIWQRIEQGDRGAFRSAISGGKGSVLTSRTFKHCVECVREQQLIYGVGHWMTPHQIAGVGRCQVHDAPLMDQCADCGAGIGGPQMSTLPSDACANCGGTRRSPTSTAELQSQQSYVLLIGSALDGVATDLRPTSRRLLLSQARHILGSDERIVSGLLNAWGALNFSELAASLECEIRSQLLIEAIQGGHLHGVPRPLVVAIIAYCRGVVGIDAGDWPALSDQLGLLQDAETLTLEQQTLFALLHRIAPVGYPVVALRAFAQGRTLVDVMRNRLASRSITQELLFRAGGAVAYIYPHLRMTPFPRTWSNDLKRIYFRQIADSARKQNVPRAQLAKKIWGVYLWLLKNDRAWLDENYPCSTRENLRKAEAFISR
jgi:hypothetical protein